MVHTKRKHQNFTEILHTNRIHHGQSCSLLGCKVPAHPRLDAQVEGTFHFRTTFLPSEKDIVAVCDRLKKFHGEFLEKYGAPEN